MLNNVIIIVFLSIQYCSIFRQFAFEALIQKLIIIYITFTSENNEKTSLDFAQKIGNKKKQSTNNTLIIRYLHYTLTLAALA